MFQRQVRGAALESGPEDQLLAVEAALDTSPERPAVAALREPEPAPGRGERPAGTGDGSPGRHSAWG